MVQFFRLAKRGEQSGWVGQITGNAFMDREFGVPIVESFLANRDLRLVEDTSGAYIPGHGTPTIIIVGQNRLPVGDTVRVVLSVRGEPGRPENAAKGHVWASIVDHVDDVGWDDGWISVVDIDRKVLATHPWTLRGGGAIQLIEAIESGASRLSTKIVPPIGRSIRAGADEAFLRPIEWKPKNPELNSRLRELLTGEDVRDWDSSVDFAIFYPYIYGTKDRLDDGLSLELWPMRTLLVNRSTFSGDMAAAGLEWWEYMQHTSSAYSTPLSIAFAFVATHNHFVLDRGGKIFNRSAPVVKLAQGTSEDEHLALLGVLNSSTACFWLKQVSHSKGNGGIGGGIGDESWEPRYEFTGTTLEDYPLPDSFPLERAQLLDLLARDLSAREPSVVFSNSVPTREALASAQKESEDIRARMIAQQEELDWEVYRLYGLTDEDLTYTGGEPPRLVLGERAFEIELGGSGEETAWFVRHGSTPITEIPADWPADYGELVRRRLELIAEHPYIRLLEKPEYKRRWSEEPWKKRQEKALRTWLLDRVENRKYWCDASGAATPKSVAQLADEVARDPDLVSVLALWEGRPDVPVTDSLARLLDDEAVPFLAAYRYKDPGLRKREVWEATWAKQRREDAGEKVGDIPVPPKYTSTDFRKPSYWRARGKLDVPKERFIHYPDAGREGDSTPLIGWAGWDHARQALALAAIINDREQEGWDDEQLLPLVAGLAELQPWVVQWHSDVIPEYGASYAAICQQELDERAAQVGKTAAELASWRPAATVRGRKKVTKA